MVHLLRKELVSQYYNNKKKELVSVERRGLHEKERELKKIIYLYQLFNKFALHQNVLNTFN